MINKEIDDVNYSEFLERINALMNAEEGTPEIEELSSLVDIVMAYEAKRFGPIAIDT